MTVRAEWVFKPIPGQDPATVAQFAKEAMAIWTEAGGKMRLWIEQWGDYSSMRVTGDFDNFEAFGKAHDAVAANPKMKAWGGNYAKSGSGQWLRSAVMRELV